MDIHEEKTLTLKETWVKLTLPCRPWIWSGRRSTPPSLSTFPPSQTGPSYRK